MTATRQLQIVILFAFITRLLLLYCFPLHMTDYMLINSAAQNLRDGHGMGFIRSSPENLSTFYFEGLRLWPPLVTLTTSLFLTLTGSATAADMLMMCLVLIGFIWSLYQLCKEMGLTTRYITYVFIVFAINPELIKRPGYSDLAAAFLCIWALLLLIKQLKRKKPSSILTVLFFSLVFFLPSGFRYQYYPISLLFPLYLLGYAFYSKDRLLVKQSLLSFLLVLLFLFLQEYFLFVYTAQPIDQSVAMDKTGFFFYNLKSFYPFSFKTFVNISFLENTWAHIIIPIKHLYFFLAGILVASILLFAIRYLLTTIQLTKSDKTRLRLNFSVLALIPFMLFPVMILVGLSLTHNSRSGQAGGWTYVNEGRYYIVPSILLLLLTLWLVQQKWSRLSSILKRLLITLFIISIAYNFSLTLKFYYNVLKQNIPDKELSNRTDRAAVYNYLQTFGNDSIPTVLTYTEPYFTFFPYVEKVAITSKMDLLSETKMKTKQRIRLLIIAQKDKTESDIRFITKYKAIPVLRQTNCTIYSTIIEPGQ